MANTVFTIGGGAQDPSQEDVEVYIDIDAVARPNPGLSVGHVLLASELAEGMEAALAGVALSCVDTDFDGNPVYREIPVDLPDGDGDGSGGTRVMTGADVFWSGPDWYARISLTGDARSRAESGRLRAEDVLQVSALVQAQFTQSDDYDFSPRTLEETGKAVAGAAQAFLVRGDDQKYRHRMARLVNVNAVKNSIRQIFTWIPGERIINPEFGSRLRKYLYEQITDQNQELIVAEIKACVLKWEPRAVVERVVKVTTPEDVEQNTVRLDIYYRIKGLSDEQFMYQYEYSRPRYSAV